LTGSSWDGLAVRSLIALAIQRDLTVYATTRREQALDQLERLGANHVLIDDGAVADQVRAITQTAWMVRSSWSG
jgi:NADPH:quinone reductase